MLSFSPHIFRYQRLWKVAASVIVLLTALLQASHVHAMTAEADDYCVLCHVQTPLDHSLCSASVVIVAPCYAPEIPPAIAHSPRYRSSFKVAIRGPPTLLANQY